MYNNQYNLTQLDAVMQMKEDVQSALAAGNPYYPYVLFYIPSLNRFMDHEWVVVHDLSTLFNAWQIDSWKMHKRDDIIVTKDIVPMMVYFLNEEEDEDVLDYLNYNDSFGVKSDRNFYDHEELLYREMPR